MPISEPYNPFNDADLNPLARRGSDIIKRFVQPAGTVSGGGNGVTSLDDPTYLGFSLRFDISSPLFNGATNGSPVKPPSETPVLDSITELASGQGLAPPASEPKLAGEIGNSIPGGESAIGYLQKVGENTRASYLASFIQGLREVNEFRPYYWQTIDGLTDAWTKSVNMLDPYQGATDAEGITIGCLEAVDLKISALFNLYRAAVYDVEYRRTVLPKNLMHFKVYVDIFEIRKFKSTQGWLSKLNISAPKDDVERFLNSNTSKITFVFDECTWVPAESGKTFERVTNAGGNEMTIASMKWQYGSISIESDFSGIDQSLSDAAKLQTGGNLGTAVKNATKNQAVKAADATLSRGEGAGRALIQSTVFGNAFGLVNQALGVIRNPGALTSAIQGASVQTGGIPAGAPIASLGDNPFGEALKPANSLPSDNLFGENLLRSVSSLSSSNVFGPSPSGPPPLTSNNI